MPQYALILGHLKTINFPFGTNGKLIVLGAPILQQIRMYRFFTTADVITTCTNYYSQPSEFNGESSPSESSPTI